MMRFLFAFAFWMLVFAPGALLPSPQEPKACDDGWVKVWEAGRYVCEPEEKTFAVFESDCIAKVEVTKESRIYMSLNWQGNLDSDDWSSEHLKLTLKENCSPHYEKRKAHQ